MMINKIFSTNLHFSGKEKTEKPSKKSPEDFGISPSDNEGEMPEQRDYLHITPDGRTTTIEDAQLEASKRIASDITKTLEEMRQNKKVNKK